MHCIAVCNEEGWLCYEKSEDGGLVVREHYASLEELFVKEEALEGFWIAQECCTVELLYTIRRSSFWYLPVVTQSQSGSELEDAVMPLQEAITLIEEQSRLRESLDIEPQKLHGEERILYFLHLRNGREITPQFDKASPFLYRYVLLEAIAGNEYMQLVTQMVRHGLLEHGRLIDRVRRCTHCHSAHIYFIDRCPQCKSIDISKKRILHCFACGHVEEEEAFKTPEGLVCPKCHSRLRLIGVDYDLPATQYKCNSCANIFEEPQIIARCMECMNEDTPQQLERFDIHSVMLTFAGSEYLLLDRKKVLFSVFSDNIRNIKFEEFGLFLEWMISIYKRKPDFAFAVVKVEFTNMTQIMEFFGFAKTNELFDELSRRLLELLRDTDIISLDDEYRVWMLLPATFKRGIEKRLKELFKSVHIEGTPEFKADIQSFYAAENEMEEYDARRIIEMLSQKR